MRNQKIQFGDQMNHFDSGVNDDKNTDWEFNLQLRYMCFIDRNSILLYYSSFK